MVELEKAKALLKAGGHTCVIMTKTGVFTSNERGVKPLLSMLNADMGTANAVVADKIAGKAAAFLYELMKIDALFAFTISEPALEVLKRAGIYAEYETLVPCIRNRTNTGRCPMESAGWDISDAEDAQKILENKIRGGTI